MAQFTCFANLKEQREANKKKFCDVSSSTFRTVQPVADLGEGLAPTPPPPTPPSLFWLRKEEITEERKAGRASKTKLPPTP